MEICDFSSVMQTIKEYISDSRELSQTDLLYEIFSTFINDEENAGYDFDIALVCKWFNGQKALTPKISRYYQERQMEDVLISDIRENVVPLFYDASMCAARIYDLLMLDDTISGTMKAHITEQFQCSDPEGIARLIGRTLYFTLQRNFIKHTDDTMLSIAEGRLSPAVSTYIIGSNPPLPCKYFVGRESEIKNIRDALSGSGKIFLHGIAGMGKSETAKAYAKTYRKEYTNQIYIFYSGSLQKDIASLEFVNDPFDATEDELFRQHNRFLRTLKEDTLLIIDNFNIESDPDPILSVVMKYSCHVLFTTRNLISGGESIYLDELDLGAQEALMQNLYKDAADHEHAISSIIFNVQNHTFAIELAARMLQKGIMTPEELSERLFFAPVDMSSSDKIKVSKDGETEKATYADHIRTLFGLYKLAPEYHDILRCMTLMPEKGASKKYFARWMGITNLNPVSELIEMGLIHEGEGHRISIHGIIQKLIIAELKPSISGCKNFLKNIQYDCTLHGNDEPDYYDAIPEVIDKAILSLTCDEPMILLRVVEDAYAYFDRPNTYVDISFWLSFMESMIEKEGIGDVRDRILLLDYKASQARDDDDNGEALKYEKEAASLITEVTADNALLYSNVHANLGTLYFMRGELDNARPHIEEGIRILKEFDLLYMHDAIPQTCLFAQLQSAYGNVDAALSILEKAGKVVAREISIYSTDYANIEETIGSILACAGKTRDAIDHFRNVLKAYAEIYEYDPECLCRICERLCTYFPKPDDARFSLLDNARSLCDKKLG